MGIELIYGLIAAGATLVVIAIILFMAIFYRRVVPTNMVHIVQQSKKTVPYGRGKEAGNVYYAFPVWMPIIGVSVTQFPESIFQIDLKNYAAYDVNKVPFLADVTAFFRINDATTASQSIASYPELLNQIDEVVSGVVRNVLATNDIEFIMKERSELGEQFTKAITNGITKWGVETVKSVEFKDIRDQDSENVIANIMAKEKSRIEKESRIVIAENMQVAASKEIDAQREIDIRKQDALQQVGIKTAITQREVGIAKEQSQQEIKVQEKITTERNMEVIRVQEVKKAEIAKSVAEVNAEQDKRVQVINAEAAKDAQIVKSTADKEALVIDTQGQKESQVLQAEGQRQSLIIKAEGDKQSAVVTAEGERQSTMAIADGNLHAALNDAKGIKEKGLASAEAEKAMLQAPVEAQISLAREIGTNQNYQSYLIEIRKVEADEAIGVEQAKALSSADLKILANSGNVQTGLKSFTDILTTSKGGNAVGNALEGLSQTPLGQQLISKYLNDEGDGTANS